MSGTVGEATRLDELDQARFEERAAELKQRAASHYVEQAAAANMPVVLKVLAEARAMLGVFAPDESYELRQRIDGVINQATPRGEPSWLGSPNGHSAAAETDLVWERLPSGGFAWLKADLTDPDRSPQRLFGPCADCERARAFGLAGCNEHETAVAGS